LIVKSLIVLYLNQNQILKDIKEVPLWAKLMEEPCTTLIVLEWQFYILQLLHCVLNVGHPDHTKKNYAHFTKAGGLSAVVKKLLFLFCPLAKEEI